LRFFLYCFPVSYWVIIIVPTTAQVSLEAVAMARESWVSVCIIWEEKSVFHLRKLSLLQQQLYCPTFLIIIFLF